MRKNNVEQFYDQNGGEKLIDHDCYVPEIDEYLKNEIRFISQTLEKHGYSGMLEIGCMNGRNLEVATVLGIKYVGIDIVKRFIEEANKKMGDLNIVAIAKQCDVKNLHEIRKLLSSNFLAVFPFNSFGNIDNPQKALNSVSRQGLDSLILTYGTDAITTNIRKRYLTNSQMEDLKMAINPQGVVFTSPGGLCSYAYSSDAIKQMGDDANYKEFNKKTFSKIGKGYHLKK